MIIVRPLYMKISPGRGGHLEGLSEILRESFPGIRLKDDVGLISVSFCKVVLGQLEFEDLHAQILSIIEHLDGDTEQRACEISAVFNLPLQIFAIPLKPFFGLLDAEEFAALPIWTSKELELAPDILRPVEPRSALALLRDRPEAARLLAALSDAQRPTAKFLASIRVFEAVFGLAGKRLIEPLSRFLEGRGDYNENQVAEWIKFRDRLVHADREGRPLYDGDVFSEIQPIKQAAHIVAYKKREWRSNSTDYGNGAIVSTTYSKSQGMTLMKDTYTSVKLVTADYFGRYPVDTENSVGFNIVSFASDMASRGLGPFHGVISRHGYTTLAEMREQKP